MVAGLKGAKMDANMKEKMDLQVIGWVLVVCGLLTAAMALGGCSIKAELGYHGLTGRDDRTQTQLVKASARKPLPQGGY
jgi:hypothetical protein